MYRLTLNWKSLIFCPAVEVEHPNGEFSCWTSQDKFRHFKIDIIWHFDIILIDIKSSGVSLINEFRLKVNSTSYAEHNTKINIEGCQ